MPSSPPIATRQRIIEIARERLEQNCIILDTETTGLGARDQICEIGLCDAQGTMEFSCLVQPTVRIPDEAIAIHGINNAMVAQARTWKEVQPAVIEMIGDRKILAFNAEYDSKMIRQTAEQRGVSCLIDCNGWGCLMLAWAAFTGIQRWQKLDNVIKEIGYKTEGAHRALSDSKSARAVLHHLAKQMF